MYPICQFVSFLLVGYRRAGPVDDSDDSEDEDDDDDDDDDFDSEGERRFSQTTHLNSWILQIYKRNYSYPT